MFIKRNILIVVSAFVVVIVGICFSNIIYDNIQLKSQVKSLETQLAELKNGADNLLYEINTLHETGQDDMVLEKADILHNKFNGSPQDVEAQKIVTDILNWRAEEAKKVEEEKERAAAEAAKSEQERLRELIRVKRVYIYDRNSVGKVDISIDFVNNSDKVIKYLTFSVIPINAVGDAVKDHDMYDSEKSFRATGPFEKNEGLEKGQYWDGWYNSTIESLKLTKIKIEYMDGSTETIDSEDKIKMVMY